MRYREPFTLYPRKTKCGLIYYYRVYDRDGRRSTGRSTELSNRALARRHVIELIRQGNEVPLKELTFNAFSKDWWIWGRCGYLRSQLARGAPGRPAISRLYAQNMRQNLDNHLAPFFGKVKKLSQVGPADIDRLVVELKEKKGLRNKTINHVLGTLRVMLNEAVRTGLLRENPMAHTRALPLDSEEREFLRMRK